MQAVLELEKIGYTFSYEGGDLRYKFPGPLPSDISIIQSLLAGVRQNKDNAIAFLRERAYRRLELRIEYNKLLAREQAGEKYLDDPRRTDEEVAKWMPLFNEILAGLNRLIDDIGLQNCSEAERLNGFDVISLLGHEASLDELPTEWREQFKLSEAV